MFVLQTSSSDDPGGASNPSGPHNTASQRSLCFQYLHPHLTNSLQIHFRTVLVNCSTIATKSSDPETFPRSLRTKTRVAIYTQSGPAMMNKAFLESPNLQICNLRLPGTLPQPQVAMPTMSTDRFLGGLS